MESNITEFDMGTKKALRDHVLALRKRQGEEELLKKSEAILQNLYETSCYKESEKILVYVSFQGEVQTRSLIERAWADGKQVAVPKIIHKQMYFIPLTDFSQLEEGYFGVLEPREGAPVEWEEALMLMPGVAFDWDHHRIGYGGGYYDRYLSMHRSFQTMALSFDFQIFDQIPSGSHDICPEYLVTDYGVFQKGRALCLRELPAGYEEGQYTLS